MRFPGGSSEQCRRWQMQFADKLRSLLGSHQPPSHWKTTTERVVQRDDHTRHELLLEAEGHSSLPVYLLTPNSPGDTTHPGIVADPGTLATGSGGGAGDNGALLAMMELQHGTVSGLGGTFTQFYGSVVGGLGFDISSTESSIEVEEFLMDSLEARREQVSGVDVNEELVDMIQFEQAFAAAAQFIQVVNGLQEEVLGLL